MDFTGLLLLVRTSYYNYNNITVFVHRLSGSSSHIQAAMVFLLVSITMLHLVTLAMLLIATLEKVCKLIVVVPYTVTVNPCII